MTPYAVLDGVLDLFEYKPGYELWRSDDDLIIEWWAIDSRDGYGVEAPELRTFVATIPLVPGARTWRDPKKAARYLRTQLHMLETHEADEWIRVDGELWFDPHTEVS